MMRLAFVTHRARPDLSDDDRLAADELRRRGIDVAPVAWDATDVDWPRYDAVVIRSAWDYHRRIDEFLNWVATLEAARAVIWNPPALVRWNHDKRYLDDLAAAGVTVVPTVRLARGATCDLAALLDARGWNEAVVKPAISASAHLTSTCTRADSHRRQASLDSMLRVSDVLVQEFVGEIRTSGEWSLVFFAGAFSHGVMKRPRAGDFRSQSEFGGIAEARAPSPALVDQARHALGVVREPWLYARVDGIDVAGRFTLMELEMIEPLLFFGLDPRAPSRFADAMAAVR